MEQAAFADWLRTNAGRDAGGAIEVTTPASGWSNDTVILALGGERLVVKLAPTRLAMFPTYDLSKEWDVLRALHARRRPPVPEPVGFEPGTAVLGRPFLVMSFVAGDIPSDDKPTYVEAGWLAEAPPERQRVFWRDLIAAIAEVHRVDWRDGGLDRLAPSAAGPLVDQLDWLDHLHRWSARPQPDIEAALDRLRRTCPPDDGAPCLLWGDARPANVVVRDFRIAALLDWELVGVGPPEVEIAWLQEMHWLRGIGASIVPPAGFPDDDGIAATYGEASGRAMRPLGWYRLLAALKVAVLMYRHLAVAVDRGRLPADHPVLRENIATRRLASLLAT